MNRLFRYAGVGCALAAAGFALATTGAKPTAQQAPADLLVLNGKVYTADAQAHFAEAVAIRGSRIAAVGTTTDLSKLRGPGTVVIDAEGRAVVPGFNDVHTQEGSPQSSQRATENERLSECSHCGSNRLPAHVERDRVSPEETLCAPWSLWLLKTVAAFSSAVGLQIY
ncbi:MAG TPA: hypothetical protein VGO75_13720 [Gemmatimonadaceae bacterium]|nr:hypothetical protein [Gemmatimonadaceae bacterium]